MRHHQFLHLNLPELDNSHTGLGEVIHLKYTSPEYSLFYDLLKIVDSDVVLGKAFLGVSPSGTPILTFSMSRKYNVEFMTEKDHQTIYEKHSFVPSRRSGDRKMEWKVSFR